MSKFEIIGPNKLQGEIAVCGAKNAAMKMIAASVLIKDKVVLENVPDITDIQTIIDILTENGAQINRNEHQLTIDTTNLSDVDPDSELVKKMRGAIVLIGPYLARYGKITLSQPGGCAIGTRPVDIHLDAFKDMGVAVTEEPKSFTLNGKLHNADISFKKVSVTATENVLMASTLTEGETTIHNCACEPEIVDLANFLNGAGAQIKGAGTPTITVEGVDNLNGTNYTVMPDRIEAGTFVALAIVSKSNLKVTSCKPKDLTAYLDIIAKMGVKYESGEDFIQITDTANIIAQNIETAVYPGLPTDLQAPMGLIMTQAQGSSKISENIFENRLNYLKELAKMGANVNELSNTEAEITGPTNLTGGHIESLDLRAGATLILAGIIASGTTIIDNAEIVDRGYEKIEVRLQRIGARIKRI